MLKLHADVVVRTDSVVLCGSLACKKSSGSLFLCKLILTKAGGFFRLYEIIPLYFSKIRVYGWALASSYPKIPVSPIWDWRKQSLLRRFSSKTSPDPTAFDSGIHALEVRVRDDNWTGTS